MDHGHYNCRDYYVSPHFAPTTLTNNPHRSPFLRHESWDELEQRSRSPASFKPKFPLLMLPLELRQEIFGYLLPRTRELRELNPLASHARNFSAVKKREAKGMVPAKAASRAEKGNVQNVVWQRGEINLLRVCKQLHDECAEMIYGMNTFLLFVTYEGITFRFRWLLPSGLAPIRSYPFLELIPERYLQLIKRVVISVDHVDSYTGMIKFNVGGKGLTHGLRRQLSKLVKALKPQHPAPSRQEGINAEKRHLTKLTIRVSNGNASLDSIKSEAVRQREGNFRAAEDLEQMLEPFQELYGVREVSVGGAITVAFAKSLEDRMRRAEPPLDGPNHTEDLAQEPVLDPDSRLCVYGNDI